MRRYVFAATGAALLLSAIVCSAQVTEIPASGVRFTPPKGFASSGKLIQAIREHTGKTAGTASVPNMYYLDRPYYPSVILVKIEPCPDSPMPAEIGPVMRQGFLATDPTMTLLSEGWTKVGGEPAYMVTASAMLDPQKPGVAPFRITKCFTAIARHGKLTTFLFTARADVFSKDAPAYSQMLKSVRWMQSQASRPPTPLAPASAL